MDTDLIFEFLLSATAIVVMLFIALLTGQFARMLKNRATRKRYTDERSDGDLTLEESLNDSNRDWWADFWLGISTEMVGAIFTTIIFGVVLLFFQESQAERRLQADLIFDLGSPTSEFAIQAARRLDREGWLTDGTLRGVELVSANLSDAPMTGAAMPGAFLEDATLVATQLSSANLVDASLSGANLQRALLFRADLERADLSDADLRGTVLWDADLQNAILAGARFDQTTTLPDQSRWNEGVDMARFTDPTHPNFWRSTKESSPAFVGG